MIRFFGRVFLLSLIICSGIATAAQAAVNWGAAPLACLPERAVKYDPTGNYVPPQGQAADSAIPSLCHCPPETLCPANDPITAADITFYVSVQYYADKSDDKAWLVDIITGQQVIDFQKAHGLTPVFDPTTVFNLQSEYGTVTNGTKTASPYINQAYQFNCPTYTLPDMANMAMATPVAALVTPNLNNQSLNPNALKYSFVNFKNNDPSQGITSYNVLPTSGNILYGPGNALNYLLGTSYLFSENNRWGNALQDMLVPIVQADVNGTGPNQVIIGNGPTRQPAGQMLTASANWYNGQQSWYRNTDYFNGYVPFVGPLDMCDPSGNIIKYGVQVAVVNPALNAWVNGGVNMPISTAQQCCHKPPVPTTCPANQTLVTSGTSLSLPQCSDCGTPSAFITVQAPQYECEATSDSNRIGCILEGTKVLAADGSLKRIDDIKLGDHLRGDKGKEVTVKAMNKFTQFSDEIYGFNGGTAFITAEHPMLTTTGWKSINPEITSVKSHMGTVGKLAVGDKVVTHDGILEIHSIERHGVGNGTTAYNLSVKNGDGFIANDVVVKGFAQVQIHY